MHAPKTVPPSERFRMISSGYLLLIRDGKILLSRRFRTGYEDGNYGVPSGHIEEHETLRQGTSREVQEEIGLVIPPEHLILVHVMHRRSNDERMDYFFVPERWAGEPKNMEPHRCDDLTWFHLNHLPTNTIPYIRTAIDAYCGGVFYLEFGWKL